MTPGTRDQGQRLRAQGSGTRSQGPGLGEGWGCSGKRQKRQKTQIGSAKTLCFTAFFFRLGMKKQRFPKTFIEFLIF